MEGGGGGGEGAEEGGKVKVGEGVEEEVRWEGGFVEEAGAGGAGGGGNGGGGGGGNGGDIALPPAFATGREGS